MENGSDVMRRIYMKVNLNSLSKNVSLIRDLCYKHSKPGIIAVVKADAYGHGAVLVSHHLKKIGVERLAVVNSREGIHLRNNDIQGPIHVLGSSSPEEMEDCLEYELIPTLSNKEDVECLVQSFQGNVKWNKQINRYTSLPVGSVNIEIDTGLSRYGCQPDDLPELVQICKANGLNIDGMFTQFVDAWNNEEFTKKQLRTFLEVTLKYREEGIKLHAANSNAVFRGYGLDLDFVRPGSFIYGITTEDISREFLNIGLKPIASLHGRPSFVKKLGKGRTIGYACSYKTEGEEWVATFPIGYSDGYWRALSHRGIIIRDKTGERCPVVGQVTMNAITVKLPEEVTLTESFTIISDDYDPETSLTGIAAQLGTLTVEIITRLSSSLHRKFMIDEKEMNMMT